MRTGVHYLESLRDGREIYVDGERVGDVTRHPAFAAAARTIAGLYDLAAEHRDEMTYPSPETGEPVLRCYMMPRSIEDLRQRRTMISRWADATYGLMGRAPDHVASFLAGFASAPEVFARYGRELGRHVTQLYEKARENHRYVAYPTIQPQGDRPKSPHEQAEPYLAAGVCKETDGGIVIRGAQMLGTGAALADYLLLSCIQPLRPGDEDYAISVVLPVSAPGLRLYPRRPYACHQPSTFDYPLSTRFDETDSLAVFHDVFVPWKHVFVYRDVNLTRAQWFETPAHILGNNQAQIRLVSKVKFLAGLAQKIASTNGIDKLPPVQTQLGDVASLAAVVEGMELASEATAVTDARGIVHPNPRFLYGAMGLQAELYPRLVHLVRELAVVRGEGAWDRELGTLPREVLRRRGPALLFANMRGYSGPDARCSQLATSLLASHRRIAILLGFDDALPNEQLVRYVQQKNTERITPVLVDDGPVHEQLVMGEDVDLNAFPVPRWHHLDGGRYINTFGAVVTKDPDTGDVNLGVYRGMIVDRDKIAVLLVPSQHWGQHWAKYKARNQPMPVASVYGWDPIMDFIAGSPIPKGVCEYDVMSAYLGQPVPLVKCRTVDLEVPASAEIVVEGWISPDPSTYALEGPFGEFTGYVSDVPTLRPVIQV